LTDSHSKRTHPPSVEAAVFTAIVLATEAVATKRSSITNFTTATTFGNQARACWRRGREAADLRQRAREAAKEYHNAIRGQKKAHWDSFLEDGANIWQSAKYPSPGGKAMGNKIPPLKRRDRMTTSDKAEQAEELLSVFFTPLALPFLAAPAGALHPRSQPAELTLEEVEEKVMAAKACKAPGEDGLPAMVWKQLWPVVGDRVLHLF
jgi:hypothetical protein